MESAEIIWLQFQFDGVSKLLQGSKCPQAGSFMLHKWAAEQGPGESSHHTISKKVSSSAVPEEASANILYLSSLIWVRCLFPNHCGGRSPTQTTCVMGVVNQRKSGWRCERRKWMLDGQPEHTWTRNILNKILKVLNLIVFKEIQIQWSNLLLIRLIKRRNIVCVCERDGEGQNWE